MVPVRGRFAIGCPPGDASGQSPPVPAPDPRRRLRHGERQEPRVRAEQRIVRACVGERFFDVRLLPDLTPRLSDPEPGVQEQPRLRPAEHPGNGPQLLEPALAAAGGPRPDRERLQTRVRSSLCQQLPERVGGDPPFERLLRPSSQLAGEVVDAPVGRRGVLDAGHLLDQAAQDGGAGERALDHLPLHRVLVGRARGRRPGGSQVLDAAASAPDAAAVPVEEQRVDALALRPLPDAPHGVVERHPAGEHPHALGRIGVAQHDLEVAALPHRLTEPLVLPGPGQDVRRPLEHVGQLEQRDHGDAGRA